MKAATRDVTAVVVRRTIAASAEDLFDAWLDPVALGLWMRPSGIRHATAKTDPRVGGSYEIIMHGDANTYAHHGVYRRIERPRRIVFTWTSQGTQGQDTLVTVDFLRVDERTEVVVTHELLPEEARASHSSGWTSGIESLAAFAARRATP